MKKLFSIIMSVLMIACFMPTMAFATSSGGSATTLVAKSVNIGADAITVPEGGWNKTVGNYLYYGSYSNKAVKYRVLSNSNNAMLIDSDVSLWGDDFSETETNYAQSDIYSYLRGAKDVNNALLFSEKEITSIKAIDLQASESDYNAGTSLAYSDRAANGNSSFLLTADEANKLYEDKEARKKTGEGGYWWLRSAVNGYNYSVGCVQPSGALSRNNVYGADYDNGVAPASYLNTGNILFTTEKSFDKAQTLTAIGDATSKEWKVTLKDTSKTVTAGKAVLNVNEVRVPVTLTGSAIDQVSVVITSGEIGSEGTAVLYYGKLDDVDGRVTTEQTGTFTLPSELPGEYKIYLLAEDLNTNATTGSITDYASEPVEINPAGVAKVGETDYATLENAIAAVEEKGTLTLLDNVTTADADKESPILINTKDITINMGSHNITLGKNKYFLVVNGSLALNGTGTVSESVPTMAPVVVVGSPNAEAKNYTNVTVGSGVTLKGYCGIKVQYIDATGWGPHAYGTSIVVDGNLVGVTKSGDATALGTGIEVNGDIKDTTGNVPEITLAEGSSVTATGCGIYAGGYAKWTLNGTVNGTEAVSMKSGNVTVNGGTYSATGAYADPADAHNDGAELTGAALSMTSNSDYAHEIKLTIEDGTFTSANGNAVYEGITKGDSSFATLTINGGSFTGAFGKDAVKTTGTKFITAGTFSTKPNGGYVADNRCVSQDASQWTVGEHVWETAQTVDKEATCNEAGSKSTHCSKCDETKDTETIKQTSHTWADPTYTWSEDGKNCTATRVCTVDSEHKDVQNAEIASKEKTAATCVEKGTTTYTATFSDTTLKAQTKDIKDIPALGHKLTHVAAKDATTSAEGNYEYWYCENCQKYFKDSKAATEYGTNGWKIAKKASSGGGGGGSSSSTTTTTDTVTNKTEDKTTNAAATTTATVKNTTTTASDGTKTVAATVDTTTATKIVEKAVENKSEEVVVNAATKTTVSETAAGTKTEVAIPAAAVSQVAEKTDAAVTIKADAAEVTLDKEAVAAVAEAAGTTGEVKLVVDTVAQEEGKVEVDLKLVTASGNVSEFKGGKVSVTIKLNAKLAAKDVKCLYIDDAKAYHKVDGQKNADGTFTFKTGHFSSYAVVEAEEADKLIAEQDTKVAGLTKDLTLKARSAKTEKGNIKVTLTVDADDIKAIEDLGYTVKYKFYRSTKKAASYTAKIEGTGKTYINTTGKKGTKYYYKARVMVYDADGTLVAKSALKQCRYAARTR